MRRMNGAAMKSMLAIIVAASVCLGGQSGKIQQPASSAAASGGTRSTAAPLRYAKTLMTAEEKLVRDVYTRLMRYQSAAVDKLAVETKTVPLPSDYVTFEIRNVRVGSFEEIFSRPAGDFITTPRGEVLRVTPNHLSYAGGPPHAYYDVGWEAPRRGSATQVRGLTVEELALAAANEMPARYAAYEVRATIGSRAQVYYALAFFYGTDPFGKLNSYILDNVTAQINAVLGDQSPKVRNPWDQYVKSGDYSAVRKLIAQAEQSGAPLIPAQAPIGYLPGDSRLNRLMPEDSCTITVTQITKIDPNRAIVAIGEITVDIQGSGFGTNPGISVSGTGVTATIDRNMSTGDDLSTTFNIAANADPGNHTVTITNGSQQATANFFVQIPTSLKRVDTSQVVVITDGKIGKNDHQCGAYLTVSYILMDQDNPAQQIITDLAGC